MRKKRFSLQGDRKLSSQEPVGPIVEDIERRRPRDLTENGLIDTCKAQTSTTQRPIRLTVINWSIIGKLAISE